MPRANDLKPSDLKSILHSKRANLYYLEHCRVLVKGGRVEYVTDAGKESLYWNIPIANTTSVLLGTGTSITQAAVRELAKAGVLLGFCGGGGTPLFAATDSPQDIVWFQPQSEYRPVDYLHHWVQFWFDDKLRLAAARSFQRARLARIRQHWLHSKSLKDQQFVIDAATLEPALADALAALDHAADHTQLLTQEARLTKQLYRLAAQATPRPTAWSSDSMAASASWWRKPGSPAQRNWSPLSSSTSRPTTTAFPSARWVIKHRSEHSKTGSRRSRNCSPNASMNKRDLTVH